MKFFFIILLTITYYNAKAEDCFCEKDSIYNNFINCEPKILDNGAKIYWSFNCDSSWLTFENKGEKVILEFFDKDFMDFTHRLGYVYFYEHQNTILFKNKLTSGSGRYAEYFLHDKETGKIIKELGYGIYTASEAEYPFFISFVEYEDDFKIEELSIINLNTKKEYKYKIPEKYIKVINNCELLNIDQLFLEEEFDGKSIIFKFNSNRCETNTDTEKLIIDLKEYY